MTNELTYDVADCMFTAVVRMNGEMGWTDDHAVR